MSASDPNEQPTPPPPPAPGASMSDQQLRHEAEKRIAAKAGFVRYLGGWVAISIFTVIIWAITGAGYFWPLWVIVGMGFAAFWMGWNVYGPRSGKPSEQQIQDEMRRMQ
ncbi:MAG: 2TM domain-containing protein [Candidatus Nanopelagicales bacterium]|nr:2TM domain-containing protein [Candidatus Nanopelagicales bacterium]